MTLRLSALHTRAIVLDIEGTTTPVTFVYDVLFPFARSRVAEFLKRHGDTGAAHVAVTRLREELAADQASGETPPALVLDYVHWLIDRDRKSPGLKTLQGLVWAEGFEAGELRGHVYPDVAPALERWRAHGCAVYIYSSGSVLAQRLLFGSTEAGDLTTYVTGHFDTAVGPKTAPESYGRIARDIDVPPPQILFVSDVAAELDAAGAAGMRTALCVRGDSAPDVVGHPVIHTFDDIVA